MENSIIGSMHVCQFMLSYSVNCCALQTRTGNSQVNTNLLTWLSQDCGNKTARIRQPFVAVIPVSAVVTIRLLSDDNRRQIPGCTSSGVVVADSQFLLYSQTRALDDEIAVPAIAIAITNTTIDWWAG